MVQMRLPDFAWGLRAKGGAARPQTEDFTREFFAMFVSSPRSSDPARPRRAGRLLKRDLAVWRPEMSSYGFTRKGGMDALSSSRSGGLTSGNGFVRRKSRGQGRFSQKLPDAVARCRVGFAREGRGGVRAKVEV